MKQLHLVILILLGISCQNVMAAVKIVECEDEEGNKTFQSICPPGSKMVNERRVATGVSSQDTSGSGSQSGGTNISAILYSIPDCESCDIVRDYLQNRNVSVTEKSIIDNIELQEEMKEITGKQSVPVVIIGEKVLTGYNATQLKAALVAAGYTEED